MPPKPKPLLTRWIEANKNVTGINYDLVNEDRRQLGSVPLGMKIQRIDERTGEIK